MTRSEFVQRIRSASPELPVGIRAHGRVGLMPPCPLSVVTVHTITTLSFIAVNRCDTRGPSLRTAMVYLAPEQERRMELKSFDDVTQYRNEVFGFLLANEAQYCLPLGLIETMITRPEAGDPRPMPNHRESVPVADRGPRPR